MIAPETLLDKAIFVGPFEQIDWEEGVAVTIGEGFTFMLNVMGVPAQVVEFPLKEDVIEGVTVIIPVRTVLPVFVVVNAGILPVPLAPSPIDILLLAQAYEIVPPVVELVKLTGLVFKPLQTV